MVSRIEGLEPTLRRLQGFGDALGPDLADVVEGELKETQREAADLVPIRTGNGRATLLSDEALSRVEDDRVTKLRFGFLTKAMRKAAYYLFWVEFGTKGYVAGQLRFAGYDKRGRRRQQRIKRAVPARQAQPFFRPAATHFLQRLASRELWPNVVIGAKKKVNWHGDR